MRNRELAEIFERIADLLQIRGDAIYRVLAYRKAGESIRGLSRNVVGIWEENDLEDIPGVGKAIATKIDELLATGKLEFYEKLIEEVPESLPDLLRIGDVGPKKAALFWRELGVTSINDLEKAAKAGKLQKLPGMGPRSEQKILEGLKSSKQGQPDRISIGIVKPIAKTFIQRLKKIPGVVQAEGAGSLRRWRETIGDLDIVVAAEDKERVIEEFINFTEVERVKGRGETKVSVELVDGLRVQLWVHPPERFGSALQYATGSQGHNVRLREYALSQSLSLSEHGFKGENGNEILCENEEEVYATIGLPWIAPELREDIGEITAGLENTLPKLILEKDIKGEIHMHSDWSDGRASMEHMAQGALERGLEYIVITDHSRSLGIANGLSIERLQDQRKKIDRLQKKFAGELHILQGSEVEILADGSLDYPDEVLEMLDFVIISLHFALRQKRQEITSRLLAAIENKHVNMIAHLSGRLIGKREPADLDFEAIFRAAVENNVVLEINSKPDRLDLKDTHARRAGELGAKLAITTDAHRPEHLDLRMYGVGTARRAWLTSKEIINAWPRGNFLDFLDNQKT